MSNNLVTIETMNFPLDAAVKEELSAAIRTWDPETQVTFGDPTAALNNGNEPVWIQVMLDAIPVALGVLITAVVGAIQNHLKTRRDSHVTVEILGADGKAVSTVKVVKDVEST